MVMRKNDDNSPFFLKKGTNKYSVDLSSGNYFFHSSNYVKLCNLNEVAGWMKSRAVKN